MSELGRQSLRHNDDATHESNQAATQIREHSPEIVRISRDSGKPRG